MTGNLVIMLLGIIFGVMVVVLLAYGIIESKRAPKPQVKPSTVSVTKPQKVDTKSEPSDYFCQKCYATISPDLEFCSECGAKQT